MIFSVSEGRLRPGGDTVTEADTVMYSSNIVAAKEVVEMLNFKSSLSLFRCFWLSVLTKHMQCCLPSGGRRTTAFPCLGFRPCAAGVAKEFEHPYALRMQRGQR